MLEVCDFAKSLGKNIVLAGENKSDLAVDTLSLVLTAKSLKLPKTRNWLLQEELKMA